jgi:hypothetical protein
VEYENHPLLSKEVYYFRGPRAGQIYEFDRKGKPHRLSLYAKVDDRIQSCKAKMEVGPCAHRFPTTSAAGLLLSVSQAYHHSRTHTSTHTDTQACSHTIAHSCTHPRNHTITPPPSLSRRHAASHSCSHSRAQALTDSKLERTHLLTHLRIICSLRVLAHSCCARRTKG